LAMQLGDLARQLGVELRGDAGITVSAVGTLQNAGPDALSFLSNPSYQRFLKTTRAAAVVLSAEQADACPVAALIAENPYLIYARAASLLFPQPVLEPGIHPSAVVADSASVAVDAHVGPCAVIGERVQIAAGVYVGPGCVIESDCQIGDQTRLMARVTLCRDTIIGRRCLIHPGAVLGSDGFGLANDNGRWVKVPQLGRVRVGDDVEIGANTTIDRGALEDTLLHNGVKLDNLIQIAHNVEVGEHTAMAGCSAIAGSTKIGSHCTVGGQAGLVGHLTIGDNVHFSAASMVTRSFENPGYYSGGFPTMENKEWRKAVARIRRLEEMNREIKELKQQIGALMGTPDK